MTTRSTASSSPPSKRLKLESTSLTAVTRTSQIDEISLNGEGSDDLENENQCSICLQTILDRTVVPACSHEFCFECLLVWTEQSRRCPLCSQGIGQYVIHSIRSRYDFRKHYLTPLRTSPEPLQGAARAAREERIIQRRTARAREQDLRMREEREESNKLDRSIAKRRWIYQHDLYAKHVASNSYTKYRPYPTPAQFAASTELISRTTTFLRRELRVWDDLDVEFLTSFIISLMKSIDIRSESAVKLLAEFLDIDAPYVEGGRHVNAEHFAHEVYSYVRSPFRDLFVYDTVAQYDTPQGEKPPEPPRSRRWREDSCSRSRSRSRSRAQRDRSSSPRSRDRRRHGSVSWSPSGRIYPSTSSSERRLHVPVMSDSEHARRRSIERSSHRDYERPSRDIRHRDRSPEPSSDDSSRPYFPRRSAKRKPPSDEQPAGGVHLHRTNCTYTKRETTAGRSLTQLNACDRRQDTEWPIDELDSKTGMAVHGAKLGSVSIPETTEAEESSQLPVRPSTSSNLANPEPRTLEQRRPPRNRNLLESVHAHLTLRPRDRLSRIPPENTTSTAPDSQAPSLHARSPDTNPNGLQSSTIMERYSQEHSNYEKDVIPRKGMSAPEIMARTRARHARNKITSTSLTVQVPDSSGILQSNGDVVQLPHGTEEEGTNLHGIGPVSDMDHLPKRESAPGNVVQAGNSQAQISQASEYMSAHQAPPHLPISGPSHASRHESQRHVSSVSSINGSIKDISHQSSVSSLGARTRLLAKLEEEKNRARGAESAATVTSNLSFFDRTSPGRADRLSLNEGPFMDSNIEDTHSIEAKLRTRAQFQVRLAAERKKIRC